MLHPRNDHPADELEYHMALYDRRRISHPSLAGASTGLDTADPLTGHPSLSHVADPAEHDVIVPHSLVDSK